MPRLPPEWLPHFEVGVSHRLGACSRDGQPSICRALAAEVLADGSVRVLVASDEGAKVLPSIRDTGHVAVTLGEPQTHRTLHLKGRNAAVVPVGAELNALLESRYQAFAAQVVPLGFKVESIHPWYMVPEGMLMSVCFTISGAWNQTPGPGAGQAVALQW